MSGCSGEASLKLPEMTGKNIPGRESGRCKGPEAGWHLVYLRNNKEASVAGVE